MNENILTLSGSLDSEGASGIEAMFRQAMRTSVGGGVIAFDMKRVTYLNSGGLKAFFTCLEYAQKQKRPIRFLNCSEDIIELLRITHFDRFCELHATNT